MELLQIAWVPLQVRPLLSIFNIFQFHCSDHFTPSKQSFMGIVQGMLCGIRKCTLRDTVFDWM